MVENRAMIEVYLAIGLGFYVGLALKDPKGFIDANSAALIRGFLLGVIFWPIGVVVQTVFAIDELRNEKD